MSKRFLNWPILTIRTVALIPGKVNFTWLSRYGGLARTEQPQILPNYCNRFAPMDMARSLSRVRIVRVDNKWIPAEVMKKDRQLVEAVGLDITPNSGILSNDRMLKTSWSDLSSFLQELQARRDLREHRPPLYGRSTRIRLPSYEVLSPSDAEAEYG